MNLNTNTICHISIGLVLLAATARGQEQDVLPPVIEWKGTSIRLIAGEANPWITPAERSGFRNTPSYAETMEWVTRLCGQSGNTMKMISIGKSANGREINMVIISADRATDPESLRRSLKPLLLVQAGIHAGEIDGKDAGMMLLRDIAFGDKKELIRNVNILFIPILNVDGHERISAYNRVNQRGPGQMGWRTNARNLNLNRDYTKLDTEELQAVTSVINGYDPDLYLDLHVTDGADYQYDITYGYTQGYSPTIAKWLEEKLSPAADRHLRAYGHIPGPLIFATNNRDFSDGMIEYPYSARYSNNYGDLRHLPSVLVENHSLKPFRQRVLGTYVFLEAVLLTLAADGKSLQEAIANDRRSRRPQIPLTWKLSDTSDSITLLAIESRLKKSAVTNSEYVEWTGKPVVQKVSFQRYTKPDKLARRPKAYWVPGTYADVIRRLKLHGITMEPVTSPVEVNVRMYRAQDFSFAQAPFEGHVGVTATFTELRLQEKYYPGAVRIPTDQPLGDLAIYLLEPYSPDSFFQWGFFPEIFSRTEYVEEYAIEPLARKMLAADPALKKEFEEKKAADARFSADPGAIYEWFYQRSPYADNRWLLYPVGAED